MAFSNFVLTIGELVDPGKAMAQAAGLFGPLSGSFCRRRLSTLSVP
jgi:hypothetical protein